MMNDFVNNVRYVFEEVNAVESVRAHEGEEQEGQGTGLK